MKFRLPMKPDGRNKDLPDRISTMHYIDALCPTCQQPVISSSRKVFCYNCGVWWDSLKLKRIEE